MRLKRILQLGCVLVIFVLIAGLLGDFIERNPYLSDFLSDRPDNRQTRLIPAESGVDSVDDLWLEGSGPRRLFFKATGLHPRLTVKARDQGRVFKISIRNAVSNALIVDPPILETQIVSQTRCLISIPQRLAADVQIRFEPNLPNPFKFAYLGDSRGNFGVMAILIGQINESDSRFVIHGGDWVFDGQKAEYDAVVHQIRGFDVPLFGIPGNHDVKFGGRALFRQYIGPDYSSFRAGPVLFVLADNANPLEFWWWGPQPQWFRQKLQAPEPSRKVVVIHKPPIDPRPQDDHGMENPIGARRFRSALGLQQVELVLASHIHGFLETTIDDIPYLISGGAGAELVADGFFHWIEFTVSDQNITYILHRIGP